MQQYTNCGSTPAAIASAAITPTIKMPLARQNSSTRIAPEHGRKPTAPPASNSVASVCGWLTTR